MTTLIKNGTVIDPANRVNGKLNILINGNKIELVTQDELPADTIIDAEGKMVCPGFIDIHMHEDDVVDGKLYSDPDRSIFSCMLRMGVTTAAAGNCGDNACDPADYLDIVDRDGCYVNVAMFAGESYFRYAAGVTDKYSSASPEQISTIAAEIKRALDAGCCGVSYGIRYVPGINAAEFEASAAPCAGTGKPIAAHVRDDAEAIFDSAAEFLDLAKKMNIPAQFSHIGSMAGFGQMDRFLRMIESYRLNGLDVTCDCYPYSAFSTSIGSTTYDDGWMDRYNCDYSVLEICEGEFKGQRCTEETFRKTKSEHPEYETVCYVMKDSEITMALNHPNVMLGSDGVLNEGQGHPRAAGAFPRFFAHYVRNGSISVYDAINKMTAMAAARLNLATKGRLNAGADADIVIFDPAAICDNATFAEPVLPPVGIDTVIISGQIALKDGSIINSHLGRSVRV